MTYANGEVVKGEWVEDELYVKPKAIPECAKGVGNREFCCDSYSEMKCCERWMQDALNLGRSPMLAQGACFESCACGWSR